MGGSARGALLLLCAVLRMKRLNCGSLVTKRMPLLVMKFGGTSVCDLARIRNAATKVKSEVDRGFDVIVIVSAMSGKTNELVGWVNATSALYDAREYDAVVA